MVIGIVIGSGVFFKADDVLIASGGDLSTALLAWFIGGSIMVITAYVFSLIATRVEKVNGVVDYFEEAYGEKAGYLVAWFMTYILPHSGGRSRMGFCKLFNRASWP